MIPGAPKNRAPVWNISASYGGPFIRPYIRILCFFSEEQLQVVIHGIDACDAEIVYQNLRHIR